MLQRVWLLLLIPLFVASCGGGGGETQESTTAQGGKKYGGVYRMNILRGSPNGLDPVIVSSKHADDIASQIYDRLIDLNDSLALVPELALRLPEVSEDGQTYTFHLRTDATFHDNACFPQSKGRPVIASDVVYSFTRCCDPRTATAAYWAFQGKVKGATRYHDAVNAIRNNLEKRSRSGSSDGDPSGASDTALSTSTGAADPYASVTPIEGFRAVNDSTFVIELERPYAPFLYALVNSLGSVVPHEAVEHYGVNFFRNPVGSGPFVFASWDEQQHIELKRNPHYWGTDELGNRLPFLDGIRFRFITDDKVQLSEFMSGGLDESYNIPTEQFTNVFDIATRKVKAPYTKYQMQATPAMLTWYFDFNTQKPPFTSVDVRRAFNYAIDRERIVKFALQNSPYSAATHGLVPPVFPGYPSDSVKGYSFNRDSAMGCMARAGYPGGKGFPAVTMHIYPEPRLQQVAEAMQSMLQRGLGITVKIQSLNYPQFQDLAQLGKLEFWGTRWYGDYPDPETYLLLLYGKVVPTDPTLRSYPNGSRYSNPLYDQHFEKGVATIDPAAQYRHYLAAERIAIADAPNLPIFYDMHYRLLQPNVRSNPLDAMARYDLKRVWLE